MDISNIPPFKAVDADPGGALKRFDDRLGQLADVRKCGSAVVNGDSLMIAQSADVFAACIAPSNMMCFNSVTT